ncbi:MAG: DNA/RNA non-specific endonuclease [Lactobacillaceae bacterium]|jgi:hypothetical protein|nr:DNA/RNA non-specific endonuclease [Lactobacillaceae bacterium]
MQVVGNSLSDLGQATNKGIQNRQEALNEVKRAFQRIVNSYSFTGKTANSLKSYIKEVHLNGVIKSLDTLLETYKDAIGMYVSNYPQAIDQSNSIDYKIVEEELDEHIKDINRFKTDYSNITSKIQNTINQVAGIVLPDGNLNLDIDELNSSLDDLSKTISDLKNRWDTYEQNKYFENTNALLETIKSALKTSTHVNPQGYVKGSFGANNNQLVTYTKALNNYHKQNAKYFKTNWKNINSQVKTYDKQKQEELNSVGWSVLFLALAIVATVVTAGTATPLVAVGLALDVGFSANQVVNSTSKYLTGKTIDPISDSLHQIGFKTNDAVLITNIASMSTLIVGGGIGAYKIASKATSAIKIARSADTTLSLTKASYQVILQTPVKKAISTVGQTFSNIKVSSSSKVISLLNKTDELSNTISTKALTKLNNLEFSTVKLASTTDGKVVPILTKTKFSDTGFGGKVVDKISEIKSTKVIKVDAGSKGNWNKELNAKLQPNSTYEVGPALYKTDSAGRVKKITTKLELKPETPRNTYQQGKSVVIKGGSKEIHQGGHLVGRQFGGAGEQINYLPMTKKLNQGAWKDMEMEWSEQLKQGHSVEIEITPIFKGDSKLPESFKVRQWTDGQKKVLKFKN